MGTVPGTWPTGQRPVLTAVVAGTEDGIICSRAGAEGAVRTGEVVNQPAGAIGPQRQRPVLAAEAAAPGRALCWFRH